MIVLIPMKTRKGPTGTMTSSDWTPKEGFKHMPQMTFSTAMTANQLGLNPVNAIGWQYEFLPWPARVSVMVRATDVNERMTVYSGSETIQEKSPVQGGGTAGVTPSELNTPPITWFAAAGDRIKLVIDNTTAGTPTVDGIVVVNPL